MKIPKFLKQLFKKTLNVDINIKNEQVSIKINGKEIDPESERGKKIRQKMNDMMQSMQTQIKDACKTLNESADEFKDIEL